MEHNLCVLIDFENIAAGCEKENLGRFNIKAVMDRLKDKGRILEARAYGDWGRFARFKQSLLEQGVNMIELTSYRGQDKNRADIALVVDAMELAFTRDYLDTYVVLSGDSDFTPLVNRLRAMNKRVIGLGTRGSTSRLIIASVDEFIFYDSLRKDLQKRPEPAEAEAEAVLSLSKEDAFTLLVETLAGLQKDDPHPVLAGLVKQSMQRKAPTFDESDYGYSGFARFLEAARAKRLVHLARAERAGGYHVEPPGAATDDAPPEEDTDDLPTLNGDPLRWRDALQAHGTNPLSHMIRHTVVHEFVDHVADRAAKKRKNSLKYTIGDTARRCRKADPPVPTRHVRVVVNALAQAGLLLHPDGTPVRSPSAPFEIRKDPEELLEALLAFYIKTLRDTGEDVSNVTDLSRLLYGDEEHAESIRPVVDGLAEAAPTSDDGPVTEEHAAS
jgi:uncharacterized LabA/DUF88 family protein